MLRTVLLLAIEEIKMRSCNKRSLGKLRWEKCMCGMLRKMGKIRILYDIEIFWYKTQLSLVNACVSGYIKWDITFKSAEGFERTTVYIISTVVVAVCGHIYWLRSYRSKLCCWWRNRIGKEGKLKECMELILCLITLKLNLWNIKIFN